MDDVDFLLLDYIVELPAKFSYLSSVDADSLFNRSHHGLDDENLLKRLSTLVRAGLVCTSTQLTEKGIYTADTVFSLTSEGGKVWEMQYSPKWDRYIKDQLEFIADEQVVVTLGATNPMVLRNYLSSVDKNKYNITKEENWAALYWKCFKLGYSVCFVIDEEVYDSKLSGNKPIWRGL